MIFSLTGIFVLCSYHALLKEENSSAWAGIFFRVGKEDFFPAHAKMKVGACLFPHEGKQYLENCELSMVFILQNLVA